MNPPFYFVPENKSGEMYQLPIPGDYRGRMLSSAKKTNYLLPSFIFSLFPILLLTSSTLLAHYLRLGLLLIFSSNSIFMSFRVDFFHWFVKQSSKNSGKRLNTRYHEIRIRSQLGRRNTGLLMCVSIDFRIQLKMDPLQYSH